MPVLEWEINMPNKIYHGRRVNGHSIVVVEHQDDDGTIIRSYPLPNFHKFTRDEFDWGQHTPGATDLARAIMIDYLAYADNPDGLMPIKELGNLADGYYVDFKNQYIAGLSTEENWWFREEFIESWILNREVINFKLIETLKP